MPSQQPPLEAITDAPEESVERFREVVDQTDPDPLMMWYSELYIFARVCELLEVSRIVESGRASGVSTAVLARYFQDADVVIESIDNRPHAEDAERAERRLDEFDAVDLYYGDARELLGDHLGPETAVLIDGPKGDAALELAMEALDHQGVALAAVHDLHRNTFYRDLSTLLFTNRIYTDDETLVHAVGDLDRPYFEWFNAAADPEFEAGPYLKKGNKTSSYGHTLGLFFDGDEPVDVRVRSNYERYLAAHRGPMATLKDRLYSLRARGGPISRRFASAIITGWRTIQQ